MGNKLENVLPLSGKAKNLEGQRFGRLVALEPVGKSCHRNILWRCQCDCGNECIVPSNYLTSGQTKSCGCLRREMLSHLNSILKRKHGLSDSRSYITWRHMINRCEDPSHPHYSYYGGRGIKVCERWHDIRNFFRDMGERPIGRTLDRIDNDGNYEPGNCRWATRHEQNMNQRDYKNQRWFLAFNTKTGKFEEDNNQSKFAREHGLSVQNISACLHGRVKQVKGWEFDYLPFQD